MGISFIVEPLIVQVTKSKKSFHSRLERDYLCRHATMVKTTKAVTNLERGITVDLTPLVAIDPMRIVFLIEPPIIPRGSENFLRQLATRLRFQARE